MSVDGIDEILSLDINNESDQKRIADIVHGIYLSNKPHITKLSNTWEENIRFFEGDQWIYYNETNKSFQELPKSKFNDFIPRPITNMILPIVYTICSLLTKSKPSAMVYAVDEDESNIALSKISERIADAKWELDQEQIKLIDAALIMLLCGTVYRKDYFDSAKGDYYDDGENSIKTGDNAVDILSPFEVIPDLIGDSYIYEQRVQSLSHIKSRYSKKGNGYTGKGGEVKGMDGISMSLNLRERLKTSSDASSGNNSESDSDKKNSVVVEFYIQPCMKYRKGLMIVESNGILLYAGESKNFNSILDSSWHPYTECVWIRSPLRRHGVSLVENLIQLQKRLNGIDSLIMLNRMTMVNPVWMIPHGSGVAEGYIDGRPGLNIPYRPVGANGAAPQKVPGTGLPQDVYQERKSIIEEMHRIAMTNEVLGGYQPSGVNTAAALNMLLEQSFSKFSPFIQTWEKFIEGGQQKKLIVLQRNYKEPRNLLNNLIKSLSPEEKESIKDDFVVEELGDNINIRIEAGSSLPRSKIVEQQQLQQVIELGLLGDVSPANPLANQKVLDKFGLKSFQNINNPDVVKIKHVIKILTKINLGQLPVESYIPLDVFDDLQIHMKVLTNEMKKPEFSDPMGVFKQKFEELNNAMTEINSPPVNEGEGVLDKAGVATGEQVSPEQAAGPQASSTPPVMGGADLQ